ncbi:hypothetical protein [Aliirhizobium smilacinae]|uniref:Uncharacterized protein n=1 Tax=Aliirhizobium smilacinae TaxID=1395944 RepID=A0A5C4XTK5_9HYPH|nr:hypothetical protein [Rhizobium smilacinae]TNM66483.1 hypothetical protein FHP24_09875 [Rhizobium smilacinae]
MTGECNRTPSIYRLMATYWDRYDILAEAMWLSNRASDESAEHAAALDAQWQAGNDMDEAIVQICAFVPQKMEDARIKAKFVAAIAEDKGGTLEAPELAALIQSLPNLILCEYARLEGVRS